MKRGIAFYLSSICLKHPWNGLLGPQVTLIWGFKIFFPLLFYISLSPWFQMEIVLLWQITGRVFFFLRCKQIVPLLFLSVQHAVAAIRLPLGGPGVLRILRNAFLLGCRDWWGGNFREFRYLSYHKKHTCVGTATRYFSLPASRLLWKLWGKDACYLPVRSTNYRMCSLEDKKNQKIVIFTCSLSNLFRIRRRSGLESVFSLEQMSQI